jgi:type I restriction enzyme S subunit
VNEKKNLLNCLLPQTAEVRLVTVVQYGTSALASEEEAGFPILRMNNLQNDGWDLSDLKYIELSDSEADTYRLEKGDILFNRTNSKELVGKCEVFREQGHWVFASYLIRVRIDTAQAEPDFVSAFLNTSKGRVQIDRVSRQIIGMSNINAEELRDLQIPLPPLPVQQEMVTEMERARESRRRKLAKADALLSGLDAFLLDHLGLTSGTRLSKSVFAIRARQLDGPLNPERYRGLVLENGIKGTTIDSVAKIIEDKVTPSVAGADAEWDWIRIDDLENQPLEVKTPRTTFGRDIEGSFFSVCENDVLVARLGPTILNRKFILCPKTCRQTVASGEFLVLRCHDGWNPLVVLWTLRTSLYRDLIYSKARGATPSRYRVNREDLVKLPFPTVSGDLQDQLADEILRRLNYTRRLRAEAAREWEAAKARFEARLLGSEAA